MDLPEQFQLSLAADARGIHHDRMAMRFADPCDQPSSSVRHRHIRRMVDHQRRAAIPIQGCHKPNHLLHLAGRKLSAVRQHKVKDPFVTPELERLLE